MKTIKTLTALPLTALVLAAALTGCSGTTQTADTPTQGATTASAVSTPAASSAPTPVTPSATPTTDPYSQVINGVTYKGTQAAPSRIGTDTPGQPPAAEAGILAMAPGQAKVDQITAAGKYDVSVFYSRVDKGWTWKVFGPNPVSGDRSELSDGGYSKGTWFASREQALASPFTVDGRVLDRAEYVLLISDH